MRPRATLQRLPSSHREEGRKSYRLSHLNGGWPVLSRSEGRGCSAGALRFAKGGMLTFACRSEFFANSFTSAQPQRQSASSRCSSSRSCLPPFFVTHFLYPHHRHANRNRAIIHRQYSIENCARLQRRTKNPPQNISGGSLTIGRQVHK